MALEEFRPRNRHPWNSKVSGSPYNLPRKSLRIENSGASRCSGSPWRWLFEARCVLPVHETTTGPVSEQAPVGPNPSVVPTCSVTSNV